MSHSIALVAGLASLAMMCFIYFLVIRSSGRGWLRNEAVEMILVPVIIGLFVLAAAEGIGGLSALLAGELSWGAVLAAGADLIGLAGAVLTVVVFGMLTLAIRRRDRGPGNVTPLTPRPVNSGHKPEACRKAA